MLDRLLAVQRSTVLTVLVQRVKAINHRQYSRGNRDLFAREAVRIPVAVPTLVVIPHDRHNRIRKSYPLQNLRTDYRVDLHLLKLGGGELGRFVQNMIRYRELADVMQKSTGFQRFDFRD